jgi:hypothetical protein
MSGRLCCLTALFNPAGFQSRSVNYQVFADSLARQHVDLFTVELAFQDQPFVLRSAERLFQLRAHSILWQKERLLNYALSRVPPSCEYVAWLDADVLFPDGWDELLLGQLQQHDVVQPFDRVTHLRPGVRRVDGAGYATMTGLVCQAKSHGAQWLPRLLRGEMDCGVSGFAWAARRHIFRNTGGLYDRLVLGGGDAFLADCLFNNFVIHHYLNGLTDPMRADMNAWRSAFAPHHLSVGYLPIKVAHLWHGALRNRAYDTRELLFLKHEYDPRRDIALQNHVWEWASDKPGLHEEVVRYFRGRREDEYFQGDPHEAPTVSTGPVNPGPPAAT